MKRKRKEFLKLNRYQSGYILPLLVSVVYSVVFFQILNAYSRIPMEHSTSLYQGLILLKGSFISPQFTNSTSAIRLGEFSCPDVQGDGKLNILNDYHGSKCKSYDGWFPWKRYSSMPLFDFNNDPLRYSIAVGLEDTANSLSLNAEFESNLFISDIEVVALLSGEDEHGEIRKAAISTPEWKRVLSIFVTAKIIQELKQYIVLHESYPNSLNEIESLEESWVNRNGWLEIVSYQKGVDGFIFELESVHVVMVGGKIEKWIW